MKRSSFLTLGISDFWKGLIVVVLTAVLTSIYQLIEAEGLNITWAQVKVIISASLLAGIAYILKNLTTNNKGEILKKDKKEFDPKNDLM
jgi:hypothetical protein